MTAKNVLLALSSCVAAAALAQAPLGTVTNVQGVVTATQGGTGITVAPGTAIQNGMRFVTTSSGSVTLQLNSGCTVNVPSGSGVGHRMSVCSLMRLTRITPSEASAALPTWTSIPSTTRSSPRR